MEHRRSVTRAWISSSGQSHRCSERLNAGRIRGATLPRPRAKIRRPSSCSPRATSRCPDCCWPPLRSPLLVSSVPRAGVSVACTGHPAPPQLTNSAPLQTAGERRLDHSAPRRRHRWCHSAQVAHASSAPSIRSIDSPKPGIPPPCALVRRRLSNGHLMRRLLPVLTRGYQSRHSTWIACGTPVVPSTTGSL